ncbi:hypothetical protein SynRCC2555_02007 [Synechococcus sp. WH 8101]|nr:hypothetical protein SynRCC2555_02007 [Synechococcus sp. WH 8101]
MQCRLSGGSITDFIEQSFELGGTDLAPPPPETEAIDSHRNDSHRQQQQRHIQNATVAQGLSSQHDSATTRSG